MRAQKRLINESKKILANKKIKEYLEKIHIRRGYTYDDSIRLSSKYENLIESKELDGLTKTKPPISNEIYHDPNSDANLLVEWTVPKKVRDEVINENLEILMKPKDNLPKPTEDTEVSETDLP
jgi:hypothetical protein